MPTQWLCVVMGKETPDKHGAMKIFSSSLLGLLSHTGVACAQKVVVCFDVGWGETPGKHGALKVVFQ